MEKFNSGFISIIGRPNVGKSTLLNNLMGEKLVITSPKPQTTRNAIRCIYTDDNSQIVFVDTPGLTKAKNKLGTFMNKAVSGALTDTEGIIYIVEPEEKLGKTDLSIIETLKKQKVPIIAVINKIDTIPKEELLNVIKNLDSYKLFEDIIPISALKGDGTDILLNRLKSLLPEGPKYFPAGQTIDQTENFILSELIREKILKCTNEEIPHGTAVEIDSITERPGKNKIDIEATIFCERKSHKRILVGKNGSMIKKIGIMARKDIEKFLKQPVNLELFIKVRENWREKPFDLKDLGFTE